jgi:hypothetical protein
MKGEVDLKCVFDTLKKLLREGSSEEIGYDGQLFGEIELLSDESKILPTFRMCKHSGVIFSLPKGNPSTAIPLPAGANPYDRSHS